MNTKSNNLPEILNAIADGFVENFVFVEELLSVDGDTEIKYEPKLVITSVHPCTLNQHTVYRIITLCGIKGTALINWTDIQND